MYRIMFRPEDAWKTAGRCNDGTGAVMNLFFSEDYIDILRAKAICSPCAVREQCRAGARKRREPFGVWGGELFVRGRETTPKRRGRPPTGGHQAIVVEEAETPPDLVPGRAAPGPDVMAAGG